MMKVHDRGSIKWTSLMLPEHIEQLREIFTEYKEKPILDEQKQIEIDQQLKYGLTHQLILKITYYNQGEFHILNSRLKKFDQWKWGIVLADEDRTINQLNDKQDVEVIVAYI